METQVKDIYVGIHYLYLILYVIACLIILWAISCITAKKSLEVVS